MTPAEWVELGKWLAMSVAGVFLWLTGAQRKSAEKAIQTVNDRLTERIAIADERHADILKRFDAASDHYSKLTGKITTLMLLPPEVARLDKQHDELQRLLVMQHDSLKDVRERNVGGLRIEFTRLQEQVRLKVEQADREHAEFRRDIEALERRA